MARRRMSGPTTGFSANLNVPVGVDTVTLTVIASAAGAQNSTNVVVYNVVPPPPNDHFVNASKFAPSGGTVLSDNRFATISNRSSPITPGSSRGTRHFGGNGRPGLMDRWWWTPRAAPLTRFWRFIPALRWTTSAKWCPWMTSSFLEDNGVPLRRLQGFVTFDAQFGVTYYLVVAGYDPEQREHSAPPRTWRRSRSHCASGEHPEPTLGSGGFDGYSDGAWLSLHPQPNASGLAQVNLLVNDDPIGTIALGTTNWSLDVLLDRGVNTIRAVATDNAGQDLRIPATFSLIIGLRILPTTPSRLRPNRTALRSGSGQQRERHPRSRRTFPRRQRRPKIGSVALYRAR